MIQYFFYINANYLFFWIIIKKSFIKEKTMLDIKLETLLTVNEKKSFTKAAEELSLTQPAVSHHIAMLEEDLKIKKSFTGAEER